MPLPQPIRPRALGPGDTIGIVAPGSAIDEMSLRAGCDELERLGYQPYYLDSILDTDLYFAGSVERRLNELQHMFANPKVKAILCARGGYGCNHLIPLLDPALVLQNPKVFIGYSDITTLLSAFGKQGLVTFHGPMAAKDFAAVGGVDLESWGAALHICEPWQMTFSASEAQPLATGWAEGVLCGGCLSLLVASLGTSYEIQTDGAILFIEDVGEPAYRIDRMLMHLKLAGKLQGLRGILFGEMLDCEVAQGASYTLQDVVMRIIGDLGIPVAYGLSSGHTRGANRTLPFGVNAKLNIASEVSLEMDAAVSAR